MTDNKIDIVIEYGNKEKKSFRSKKRFNDYLVNEQSIWRDFFSRVEKYINDFTENNLQKNYLLEAVNSIKNIYPQVIANILDRDYDWSVPSYIHQVKMELEHLSIASWTTRGKKVFSANENELLLNFLLLYIWMGRSASLDQKIQGLKGSRNTQDIINFRALDKLLQDAYVEAGLFERGISGRARAENKALQSIKSELDTVKLEIEQELDNFKEEIRNANSLISVTKNKFDRLSVRLLTLARASRAEQKEKLLEIEDKFHNKLALSIPVTYWSEKEKNHRASSIIWGVVFVLLVIFSLLASFCVWDWVKDLDIKADTVLSKQPFILISFFIFPVFLIVWALKIVIRNLNTNINQMHDAKNRQVMTKTFLALIEEGKATEEDRILILNALFQPINLQGSGDITPPHWFEVMMERIKNKQG